MRINSERVKRAERAVGARRQPKVVIYRHTDDGPVHYVTDEPVELEGADLRIEYAVEPARAR